MTIDAELLPSRRWCRVAGINDLGRAQGSGLREPSYLLRRGDGQVLQVSELLHLIVEKSSASRDEQQLATAVTAAYGRELNVAGLRMLVEKKLVPMGLLEDVDQPSDERRTLTRADPLLALRLRGTLLSAPIVRRVARAMAPMFRPGVVVIALLTVVVVDVQLWRRGDLRAALLQVLATPTALLAVLALLLLGSLLHELGHAAACAYGGAQPGVIGVGMYLMFPAFFTNVTDSYRLGRAGRVRTDLGGLYLNAWCLIGLGAGYLVTGHGLFLLVALLMHIEMIQQLVPTVRFDGYYVLADVAGVPDLFSRVRPVMRSLMRGHRRPDRRVSELRPAARWIVTGWVLFVVPTLAFALGWLIFNMPYITRQTMHAVREEASGLAASWNDADPASVALEILSIVLLVLPLLGLLLLWRQLVLRVARWAVRAFHHRSSRTEGKDMMSHVSDDDHGPVVSPNSVHPDAIHPDAIRPEGVDEAHVDDVVTSSSRSPATRHEELTALAFSDEAILGRPGRRAPGSGWRRAVYVATAGAFNPGPSSAEQRHAALLERVTAPIRGSRRVVVMSRKGGVGKTTIALALGSTFAMLRGDRVIAVDANPDAGNLAHRVSRPSPRAITDVLGELDLISSYSDLRSYTSQAPESRLEVLASDDDPRIGLALDRQSYHRVIELLDHYYNLILLDTGTGILDSANQGLLVDADQLVIVLRPAVDGARAAALTLDWLSEHDYGELVARAVVVINATRRSVGVPVERIDDHFARRCAKVITVPWDRSLEAGAQTSLSSLQPQTREAFIELAAAVADQFAAQDRTRDTDTRGNRREQN